MQRTRQILEVKLGLRKRPRFPVAWSVDYIQSLRDTANSAYPLRSPIDDRISALILLAVEGQYEAADSELIQLMGERIDLIQNDHETFISTMFALFVLQQFGLLSAMLQDRSGFMGDFSVDAEEGGAGGGQVRWDISEAGSHRFVFDARTYQYDKTRNDILGLFWGLPLYARYAASSYREHGSVLINMADIGYNPGLCWCDSRPDRFLIPDCIFIPTRGYEGARDVLTKKLLQWEDRKDIAFWRGGTTGVPRVRGDWRTLERIALCELAKSHEHLGIFDVGLSSIVQIPNPADVEAIKTSGLLSGFVSWQDWGQYRYQIDIDGNSSPWSNLFQRLLTGSTVLKVESSRALRQWFYNDLVPWVNYIPIAADMSDLVEKVQWLRRNQTFARQVGEAGRQLALDMTYERELDRGVDTIARCFRYFRGEADSAGPFGGGWAP